MRLRTLARRTLALVNRPVTMGVTAVALFVTGYGVATSAYVPVTVVRTVTVPAPVTSNTLGTVRYDVVSGDCPAPLVYVTRTAMASGALVVTGGCVDPATLSDSILSH